MYISIFGEESPWEIVIFQIICINRTILYNSSPPTKHNDFFD